MNPATPKCITGKAALIWLEMWSIKKPYKQLELYYAMEGGYYLSNCLDFH